MNQPEALVVPTLVNFASGDKDESNPSPFGSPTRQPVQDVIKLPQPESLFGVRRGSILQSKRRNTQGSETKLLATIALQVAEKLLSKWKAIRDLGRKNPGRHLQVLRSTTTVKELRKDPSILHISLHQFILVLPKAALELVMKTVAAEPWRGVSIFFTDMLRTISPRHVAAGKQLGAAELLKTIDSQKFRLRRANTRDKHGSGWFEKIIEGVLSEIVTQRDTQYEPMDYIDRECTVQMLWQKFRFASLCDKMKHAILESQMKEKNWLPRRELTGVLASYLHKTSEESLDKGSQDAMHRYQTGLIPELIVDFLHP